MEVKIKKINENAVIPTYGTEFSAGADLYACIDENLLIKAGETVMVKTGLSLEIPEGLVGLVYARSGLALKKGIAPSNKVGVIDSDYRGEIMVALHNHSKEDYVVEKFERIAQLVIAPYIKANFVLTEILNETERNQGGFGSTGKK
ncbi:dUTP diphosphatase [Streptobacillus canis]|uniref:dUTP diphosphatase n=1 Tax=Streptobacillus canis TaxID=2678686 RepID=UPI0012E1E059|nr:dUTP diphosphatase [Streptobacillus canis]